MPDHRYVAWFRDHTLDPSDQDYEWPACLLIAAADGPAALSWGDRLAARYADGRRCEFLGSFLDPDEWNPGEVPRIAFGEDAPDDVFG